MLAGQPLVAQDRAPQNDSIQQADLKVVIVSAHHDHEGADGSQIFNGADDNASGTVAVIDIAEAYGARGQGRPAAAAVGPVHRLWLRRARAAPGVVGVHRAAGAAA